MQELEYLSNLKKEVAIYRTTCLHHLASVYGVLTDQTLLRQASWAYARRFATIAPEHLNFQWPANVGSSYTDTFHHSHFIRAVLASVYCPNEPLIEESAPAPNLCQVANNDLERREAQVLLYQALAQLIPVHKGQTTKADKPRTRHKSWKQRISDDITHIKQRVDEIHQSGVKSPNNEQPKEQDVDKKPNRRSKLSPKKQG